MELTNRETREHVEVSSQDEQWAVSGADPAASRIADLMQSRCEGEWLGDAPQLALGNWDRHQAAARAALVAANFQNELLAPFAVGHMFWGSWKWIGWFATEFTWVGRWIMDSVVRNDPRAANLCIEWLREGAFHETQSAALRYSLGRLTGLHFETDQDWVQWYDNAGGKSEYPVPDFDAWYEELKTIHGS
jgi:hypothetical protein